MTNEDKLKRKAYIQEASEAKQSAKTMVYWLTRDRDLDGKLEDTIDVWLKRPLLCVLPGGVGVTWICDDVVETADGDCPARYAQWNAEQCLRACYTYPATERECLRVG